MTNEDLKYLFDERVAIIIEDGLKTEGEAIAEATYQVRKMLIDDGMDVLAANIKVMGFRKKNGK